MNIDDVLSQAGDQVGVHRVFGEPIERDGVTVVPVAVVMGGGGGGSGPDPSGNVGVGAGFGVWARAIGAYEIRDGHLRFVPAVDVVAVGMLGLAVIRTVGGALRRRRRRHH
jgi:uncharacterized spore protein YtfJ